MNKSILLESLKPLLEYKTSELYSISDDARKLRSRGINTFYKGVDTTNDNDLRTIWDVDSSTGSKQYRCYVDFIVKPESIFELAKQKLDAKKISELLSGKSRSSRSNVKVHCSCPDFYWSGMQYNLGTGHLKDSLSDNQTKVTIAPDNRDPERKQVMCKHLLSVINRVPANAFDIMRDVRNFNKSNSKSDDTIQTKSLTNNESDNIMQGL